MLIVQAISTRVYSGIMKCGTLHQACWMCVVYIMYSGDRQEGDAQ